jgi:hypothetical protein
MNRWIWLAAAVLALAVIAAPTSANAAKPPPPPALPAVTQAPVNIFIDDKAKEPVLLVPRKVLASLRADAGEADPNTQRAALPSMHLIVAGTALAAALAFGGLWFLRGRHKPGATVLLVLIAVAGVVCVGSMVWANVPPPVPKPPVLSVPVLGVPLADKVKIQVVDDSDTIVLVVTKDQLTKVLEKSAPPKDEPKK